MKIWEVKEIINKIDPDANLDAIFVRIADESEGKRTMMCKIITSANGASVQTSFNFDSAIKPVAKKFESKPFKGLFGSVMNSAMKDR